MFINVDIIVEIQGVSDHFFLSMLGKELVDLCCSSKNICILYFSVFW